MADSVLVLYSAGFALIVFIIILLSDTSEKGVISYFTQYGFSHPDKNKLRFIDPEEVVAYQVESFHRREIYNSPTFYHSRYSGIADLINLLTNFRGNSYRLYAAAHYERLINFNITKRGSMSKLFGSNKGDFDPLFDDFNVRTTNPIDVQFLFTGEMYELFRTWFKNNRIFSINVKGEDDTLLAENQLDRRNSVLFESIDFLEIMMAELLSMNDLQIEEFEEYVCFNCNHEISFLGDLCTNCGIIAPKCVICFDDPEPDEIVILYNCCKSYAHQDHALTWMETESFCSSYRAEDPELVLVKEI